MGETNPAEYRPDLHKVWTAGAEINGRKNRKGLHSVEGRLKRENGIYRFLGDDCLHRGIRNYNYTPLRSIVGKTTEDRADGEKSFR